MNNFNRTRMNKKRVQIIRIYLACYKAALILNFPDPMSEDKELSTLQESL